MDGRISSSTIPTRRSAREVITTITTTKRSDATASQDPTADANEPTLLDARR